VKQRALKAGVLANPYRFIEAGQVFEHHEAMRWAEPVDNEDDEPDPAGGTAQPAAGAGRRRRAATKPAGGDADPI
jgi:hypothetical protein